MKGIWLHSVSLLFQLYFWYTVPWINQRITLLITNKNQNHWNYSYSFTKSDVKAVAPDGSLHLSPTDALSAALSYLSDTLRLFLQTIAGGNMEEQTAFIGQALIQCMRAKDLPPSLYIDFVIQIRHHFGSRFLNRLTTWAPILQLLQRGAEIWVQFYSCKVLTYHTISSINLLLTMLTTTWWH